MKIVFEAAHSDAPDNSAWQETYETDGKFGTGTPKEIIGRVIDYFNSTLRPGEKARRLVRIVSSDGEPSKHIIPHSWEKQNLVTVSDRHGTYDKMKCRICGVTGKRFGLGLSVVFDPKFAGREKYKSCTSYDL